MTKFQSTQPRKAETHQVVVSTVEETISIHSAPEG